jgi:hypothetical protein
VTTAFDCPAPPPARYAELAVRSQPPRRRTERPGMSLQSSSARTGRHCRASGACRGEESNEGRAQTPARQARCNDAVRVTGSDPYRLDADRTVSRFTRRVSLAAHPSTASIMSATATRSGFAMGNAFASSGSTRPRSSSAASVTAEPLPSGRRCCFPAARGYASSPGPATDRVVAEVIDGDRPTDEPTVAPLYRGAAEIRSERAVTSLHQPQVGVPDLVA